MNAFNQVVQWFTDNIVPLLTTSNLVAVIVFIGSIIKNKRSIADNSAASKENTKTLKETLQSLSGALERIKELEASTTKGQAAVNTKISELQSALADSKDENAATAQLSHGMLEIISLAYANSNLPADVKTTLANMAANVKYTTTNTREKIVDKSTEIEQTVDALVEIAQTVKKSTQATKKLAGRGTHDDSLLM